MYPGKALSGGFQAISPPGMKTYGDVEKYLQENGIQLGVDQLDNLIIIYDTELLKSKFNKTIVELDAITESLKLDLSPKGSKHTRYKVGLEHGVRLLKLFSK